MSHNCETTFFAPHNVSTHLLVIRLIQDETADRPAIGGIVLGHVSGAVEDLISRHVAGNRRVAVAVGLVGAED